MGVQVPLSAPFILRHGRAAAFRRFPRKPTVQLCEPGFIRMIRILLAGVVLTALAAGLLVWVQPQAAAVDANVQKYPRGEGCSYDDAVLALHKTRVDQERTQAILKSMRRVEADAGMELWETGLGRFWLKAGPDAAEDFAVQIAEIEAKPHGAIRPGAVVLDCGAEFGSFTRAALRAGAGRVFAIEPSPECLPALHRTFAAEMAAGRVVVVAAGVWDTEGEMQLHLPDVGYGGASLVRDFGDRGRGQVSVPLTTIDRLVREAGLERVDFIKMDIEGAERHALAGAAGTIRRFGPSLAISGYHLSDDASVLPRLVLALYPGYRRSPSECALVLGRVSPQTLLFDR